MTTMQAPTTLETCDACGPTVRAAFLITLDSGLSLTFCAHCNASHTYADAMVEFIGAE